MVINVRIRRPYKDSNGKMGTVAILGSDGTKCSAVFFFTNFRKLNLKRGYADCLRCLASY